MKSEKMYIDHCNKLGARIEDEPGKPGMFLWMPAPADKVCSFGFTVEGCLLMARTYLFRDKELSDEQKKAIAELVSILE